MAGTPALLLGQAGVRGHGTAKQGFEQTLGGFEPVEAVEIERDQRGKGFAAGNACQPQEMENLPISGIVQEMDALFVGAGGGFLNDGEEIAIGGKYGRCGRQQNGAGVVLGAPEDGNFGRVERRADKEIAIPSVSAPGASVPGDHTPDAWSRHNRADSRRCAAAIPSQDRAMRDRRDSRRSVSTATGICQGSWRPLRAVYREAHHPRLQMRPEAPKVATGDA